MRFYSDKYSLQFTFDNSVMHLLEHCPTFFRTIKDTIYGWYYDIDKYATGETISFTDTTYADFTWSVNIKFDTNTKTFIITN